MYLKQAYYCLDCGWIGEHAGNCEKCASITVHQLGSWLNPPEQLPVSTRLRCLTTLLDEVLMPAAKPRIILNRRNQIGG